MFNCTFKSIAIFNLKGYTQLKGLHRAFLFLCVKSSKILKTGVVVYRFYCIQYVAFFTGSSYKKFNFSDGLNSVKIIHIIFNEYINTT